MGRTGVGALLEGIKALGGRSGSVFAEDLTTWSPTGKARGLLRRRINSRNAFLL
jgi:hypothetical protein